VSFEIESDDHPKVASRDFESRALAIQNFCIRSGGAHIFRRIPFGAFDQRSPAMFPKREQSKGVSDATRFLILRILPDDPARHPRFHPALPFIAP
jgi:hypothetical protein